MDDNGGGGGSVVHPFANSITGYNGTINISFGTYMWECVSLLLCAYYFLFTILRHDVGDKIMPSKHNGTTRLMCTKDSINV